MYREATEPRVSGLTGTEQLVAEENRNASLAMWTGVGAILSLLLTCFLGSFWRSEIKTKGSIAIMAILLLVSVILFFAAAKKDERWYLVCSLLNHAGIGLAVLLLLDVLGLRIRAANLVVSGLPAAAILFGAVMFYGSGEGSNRTKLLGWAIGILCLICGWALFKFYGQRTEFWLCTAVCALLSCANLGALLWTNKAAEQRSVYKGLAVVSFSIYLLLLAAAAVALFAAAAQSGGSSNRSSKSSKSNKNANNDRGFGGVGSGGTGRSGSASFLGGLFAGSGSGTVRRTRTHYPMFLWYYTPITRYSAIDRMEGLSDQDRESARRSYRRRRVVALVFVALFVLAVIGAAILLGRG